MQTITTIAGATIQADCLGCAVACGPLSNFPGTIEHGPYFHVHQDLEIALPGFVIVSTIRHIASVAQFTDDEMSEFGNLLARVRRAQCAAGFRNVYLFQNEDSANHFHMWMFPIYDWMNTYGKGAGLIGRAISELKRGNHVEQVHRVFEVVETMRSSLQSDDRRRR